MLKISFDHIAVATGSINDSKKIFNDLGFVAGEVIEDNVQNVRVCFLNTAGFPAVELVEGVDSKSPVSQIITKMGVTPYHLCFRVNDIEEGIKYYQKNGFIKISQINYAKAFDSKIVFMYNKNFGLLELVEDEN